ncbi:unnamed protein product [Ranitomeya imitator]|uniref:Sulfotransferase n=1 Tax=Ranitomeya imitator TaxID=111125 RepID=A0ABN9MFR4_9NEOB|nr:unnamed protein product [Ranitomeya imitator]
MHCGALLHIVFWRTVRTKKVVSAPTSPQLTMGQRMHWKNASAAPVVRCFHSMHRRSIIGLEEINRTSECTDVIATAGSAELEEVFIRIRTNYLTLKLIIYTIRDPKDVAVSLYYFSTMSTYFKDPKNMDNLIREFLTENIPYGSWFNHVKGWMGLLGKDNFMFQTYEDLKKDLRGSVIKICRFLGKELDDEAVDSVVKHASFKNMKQNNMANYSLAPLDWMDLEKGPFMRKGKNLSY